MPDFRGQTGLPLQRSGNIGQRSQRDDRYLFGCHADFVANDLIRGMAVVEFGHLEASPSETVRSVQVTAVRRQNLIRRRGTDPRPSGRIELFNDDLHIASRLRGSDVPTGRRDG